MNRIALGVRHRNQMVRLGSAEESSVEPGRLLLVLFLAIPANLPFCFTVADCSLFFVGADSIVMPWSVNALRNTPISAFRSRMSLMSFELDSILRGRALDLDFAFGPGPFLECLCTRSCGLAPRVLPAGTLLPGSHLQWA